MKPQIRKGQQNSVSLRFVFSQRGVCMRSLCASSPKWRCSKAVLRQVFGLHWAWTGFVSKELPVAGRGPLWLTETQGPLDENGASSSLFLGNVGHRGWLEVPGLYQTEDLTHGGAQILIICKKGLPQAPGFTSQESLPRGRHGPPAEALGWPRPWWDGPVHPCPSDFREVATPGALLKVFSQCMCSNSRNADTVGLP